MGLLVVQGTFNGSLAIINDVGPRKVQRFAPTSLSLWRVVVEENALQAKHTHSTHIENLEPEATTSLNSTEVVICNHSLKRSLRLQANRRHVEQFPTLNPDEGQGP